MLEGVQLEAAENSAAQPEDRAKGRCCGAGKTGEERHMVARTANVPSDLVVAGRLIDFGIELLEKGIVRRPPGGWSSRGSRPVWRLGGWADIVVLLLLRTPGLGRAVPGAGGRSGSRHPGPVQRRSLLEGGKGSDNNAEERATIMRRRGIWRFPHFPSPVDFRFSRLSPLSVSLILCVYKP